MISNVYVVDATSRIKILEQREQELLGLLRRYLKQQNSQAKGKGYEECLCLICCETREALEVQ
jgi:hypothetical protein